MKFKKWINENQYNLFQTVQAAPGAVIVVTKRGDQFTLPRKAGGTFGKMAGPDQFLALTNDGKEVVIPFGAISTLIDKESGNVLWRKPSPAPPPPPPIKKRPLPPPPPPIK